MGQPAVVALMLFGWAFAHQSYSHPDISYVCSSVAGWCLFPIWTHQTQITHFTQPHLLQPNNHQSSISQPFHNSPRHYHKLKRIKSLILTWINKEQHPKQNSNIPIKLHKSNLFDNNQYHKDLVTIISMFLWRLKQ